MSSTNGIASLPSIPGNLDGISSSGPAKSARTGTQGTTGELQPNAFTGGNETAQVSSAGEMVANLLSSSDVRMDRVTSLQQTIHAGTYNVSASEVAGTMMNALMK